MKRLWLIVLVITALMLQGCQEENKNNSNAVKTIILYSELEPKFSVAIADAYAESTKGKVKVKVITELQEDGPKADLVLAEKRTLNGLLIDGRLKALECSAGAKLADPLKHKDKYWYGVFYDPVVFLVNQEFSRNVGQGNIQSWEHLLRYPEPRIVMENLSNTNSTQNFLGGFANAKGETDGLAYLWNINPLVVKYSNFPFSPVRMVAMGQADVAITRQSYVYKYLESSFPAYVVHPIEGSPINLFCVGAFLECHQDKEVKEFMDWLITSKEMQRTSLRNETGYSFLLAETNQEKPLDINKLWINNTYLTAANQERLTRRWLERVRFSNR